jgi:hypothetical protein
VRSEAGGEVVEFGLGEAVEEEVGDDEVVRVGWGEGEGVAVVGAQAGFGCVVRPVGSAGEEMKHGGADVDGVDVEVGIGGEEAGKEAAVAVAENECAPAGGELREIVVTAAG